MVAKFAFLLLSGFAVAYATPTVPENGKQNLEQIVNQGKQDLNNTINQSQQSLKHDIHLVQDTLLQGQKCFCRSVNSGKKLINQGIIQRHNPFYQGFKERGYAHTCFVQKLQQSVTNSGKTVVDQIKRDLQKSKESDEDGIKNGQQSVKSIVENVKKNVHDAVGQTSKNTQNTFQKAQQGLKCFCQESHQTEIKTVKENVSKAQENFGQEHTCFIPNFQQGKEVITQGIKKGRDDVQKGQEAFGNSRTCFCRAVKTSIQHGKEIVGQGEDALQKDVKDGLDNDQKIVGQVVQNRNDASKVVDDTAKQGIKAGRGVVN